MGVGFLDLPARGEYSVAQYRGADVFVAESLYPAGLFIAPHAHRGATLTAILGGSLDESYGRASRSCERETIVVRPAGEMHSDAVSAAGVRNLEIDLHLSAVADAVIARRFESFRHLRDEHSSLLARQISMELRASDSARPIAIEGLALEFVAAVARAAGSPAMRGPRWLMRAHERLRDRFREPVTIAELAAAAGVHPVHFARAFRARYGLAPATLLRQLRLRWAAERITGSDDSVAQIAVDAGFYDHAHFTRTFKKVMGTTPTALRARPR